MPNLSQKYFILKVTILNYCHRILKLGKYDLKFRQFLDILQYFNGLIINLFLFHNPLLKHKLNPYLKITYRQLLWLLALRLSLNLNTLYQKLLVLFSH